MKNYLYKEDFKDFSLDEFPYDKAHSALGEYHYLKQDGYYGNWYDPISNHQWRSMDGSWLITSDGTNRFLEQNRGHQSRGAFENVYSCLVLKDKILCDFTLEFDIRLFDTSKYCGMAFSYITSRNYYAVALKNDELVLFKRNQEDFIILAKVDYTINDLDTYHVKLSIKNGEVFVYLNNEFSFSCKINFEFGKCAVIAKGSSRYSNIEVWCDDENYTIHNKNVSNEEKRLAEKRSKYSSLECIKKINLSNFGTSRQLRISKTKDGKVLFLMGQHQKRIYRDSFARLSCLTMFDIDGNILWQKGEPNNSFNNTCISCDLPMQIANMYGDGNLQVIYSMDFEVIICDALTGEIIKKMPTPRIVGDSLVKLHEFDRLNVDAIRVADFSGKGYKSDFIVKDRYQNVWAYNFNFELLWRYNHKNTGHFPYIFDYDNDGHDEMFVGYDLIDHDGKMIFSLPMNTDHTDEIIYTKLNGEERFILASGNEGFNIFNKDGSLYKHNEIGHAQRVSVAHYNSTSDDLMIAVTAFWGSEGIVLMYDSCGNLIKEIEQMSNGNIITPVAYDGVNELCLLNSSFDGGLCDHELDKVVLFPKDNHPTLCCEVYDIDDDGVDEILCWDQHEMWIYKSSKYISGNKYDKYPDNGFSNYRGEYLIKK